MAKNKSTRPTTTKDQYAEVISLVGQVKNDSLIQFGEIKKDFGNVHSRLDDHGKRLKVLEKEKIEREAIEKYKRQHPEQSQNGAGSPINKELIKVVLQLVIAIGILAGAIIALRTKN